jgi:hypothetical protein
MKLLFEVTLWGLAIYGAVMGYVNFSIHSALRDYLVANGLGKDE